MQALYAKLYDKYTKLKGKKESGLEQFNHDQEVKFMNYMSDELVEHLRNENDNLREENNNLRSAMASIRSDKDEQYAEYQKLLTEEKQRNKQLSEEIERLQNLQQEGYFSSLRDERNEDGQLSTPRATEVVSVCVSDGSAIKKTRKRSRHSKDEAKECMSTPHARDQIDRAMLKGSAKDPSIEVLSSEAVVTIQQPECCRRIIKGSGATVLDVGVANCLFQTLIECLVGMKFSAVNQTEGICISALHQSSGFSFSLTWVTKPGKDESELLYQVLSLGTFERVAPEWMRDVLMFSMNMCPVFFERISRVIKLHY
ncbi:uncharacterized protein LOC131149478 isoform X2 [Malania oleifera]|uniref:uncharacterized protein LOC131149478 isoform X2 n=1 Tax=Malania oleifera TaxID=397392 RepID=UPI0025ADC23B|nr:uncharacterized protein LOC131149478 isoform X2 [Malania oleifera]